MNKYFVDTNVFLRYLTNDVPEQAQFLEDLMKAVQKRTIRLIIHPYAINSPPCFLTKILNILPIN